MCKYLLPDSHLRRGQAGGAEMRGGQSRDRQDREKKSAGVVGVSERESAGVAREDGSKSSKSQVFVWGEEE